MSVNHLDYLCGFKWYHPKWIQNFATSKAYIIIYGLLGTIQAMSHMYIIVTLTTMEKRFKMPSETTGIILSGNEISQIFLSVILSYYGGKRNRPRWIAWGIGFCALSCFIIALPHFLYGAGDDALHLTKEYHDENSIHSNNQQHHQNNEQKMENQLQQLINGYDSNNKSTTINLNRDQTLCHLNTISNAFIPSSSTSLPLPPPSIMPSNDDNIQSTIFNNKSSIALGIMNDTKCNNNEMVMYMIPLILVFLSQFILGIGNSLYYALGQTYLDDNTNKTKTPLMLAFAMTLRMIGPIIGFFLGYGSLSLFIDLKKTPLISKRDPRWLGAWWFGWIILGGIMLIFAFLMGLFPKKMPSHKKNQICQDSIKKSMGVNISKMEDLQEIKDFSTSLINIIKNKLLMCNIFSGIFYLLGALGYMTFLAKIMEVQFYKSRRDATIVIGPMIVTGMVIGFIISGWIISKRKPSTSKLLLWNIFVGIIHLCFIISHLFLYCEDPIIKENKSGLNFITGCNSQCKCFEMDVPYGPLCDKSTGISYYSACHAGCQAWNSTSNVYTDCQCLVNDSKELNLNEGLQRVLSPGPCLKNCTKIFFSFAILSMISNFIVSTGKIGNILVSFRAIAPENKSIAQGLTLMLISLLASIPGPIIYGRIIDMTCLKWNMKCGKNGNCQFYDQKKFRYYLNLTGFSLTLIGVGFDLLVWHYGKNLKLYKENDLEKDDDDEEDDGKSEKEVE